MHRRSSRVVARNWSSSGRLRRTLVVACALVAAWGVSVQDASAGGATTIVSAANQSFTVGQPSTTAQAITVKDTNGTPAVTMAGDIRIRIPATFNMTFDTSVTTVTLSGIAAGKVSGTLLAYEDSNHTAVLDVTGIWVQNDQVTIAGLKFNNFAVSASSNLQLVTAGSGGATKDTDSATIAVTAGATLSSAANQSFTVGQASTTTSVMTVTEAASVTITVANDIRIRIPPTFNMTFDTSVTTVTLGGTASAKVSTTLLGYEDSNHTAVLNVTADFVAAQTLTVTGLKFKNFTAVSAADNLELVTWGSGGATVDTDDKTITIGAGATLSSAASQSFAVGQGTTTASVMTVTEAASATITAANDIRIRIPATFNMTFDTSVTTVTLDGTASAKVSATLLAYEDSNHTAVLNVTSAFAAGETLTITGLKFNNFTAASVADNLELVTWGSGGATADEDDKTITITVRAILSSAADQSFIVGQTSTGASVITVTEAASSVTITATNDIRIRIPATFNMTFDTSVTTVTLGGTASAKVSATLLAYENSNHTAVLNVTSNFAAGQTLTITGLKFTSFTATSGSDNLELVISGTGGATVAEDDKFISIVAAFSFRKSITIDRTKVPGTCGATLSNYPMLYSVTDPALKTTGNGGSVTSSAGADIVFRALDDATCGGAGLAPCTLDHEIESYTATTGKLVAWVRVPSLNTNAAASDTVVYIYYGNPGITTSTQNAAGVWDADFKGVWHLKEGTGVTAADSTSNANSAVPNSGNPTTATGQIGGALTFANPSRLVIAANSSLDLTSATNPNWTMSAWVKPSSYTGTSWPTIYSYGSWRASMGLSQNEAGTDGRIENWTNDTTALWSTSAVTLPASWTYVTVTRTATTTSFYFNGNADGSAATPAAVTTSGQVSGIGSNPVGAIAAANQFLGIIDEVRISTVVRSACWTAAEYKNEYAPGDIGAPNFYTVGAETAVEANNLTAVELISFTATRYDRGVLLEWKTGYEASNLGFNLYREIDGIQTKVNPSLVGGSGLLAGQGTAVRAQLAYARWDLDPAAMSPAAAYYLDDLDLNGTITRHGPITPVTGSLGAPPTVAPSADLLDLGRRVKDRKVFRSHGDVEERRDGRRKAAPRQSALETQWALAAQAAIKIGIKAPGWYRVTRTDLVAAGLDPNTDLRRLTLYADGVEQAMRVIGRGDGRFAEDDTIEFYATGIDTPYSDTRVYWLVPGTHPGRRIEVVETGAGHRPDAVGSASFLSTVRQKERSIYFAALQNGETENWFGSLVSTEPTDIVLTANHVDWTAPGAAQLEVTLQGVTSSPDGSLTHVVAVLVNGAEVGEMTFAGQRNASQTFAVSNDVLVEGDNTVTLVARNGDEDFSLVDVLALTYWHTYQADADRLRATVAAGGPLTIGSFANPAIRVVDITDPSSATELRGTVRTDASGFSSITVSVPGNGPRTVLAFSDATIASPAYVVANTPSSWHTAAQAHDYVVISHGDFIDQVKPLVALREQQGHRAAVVDVDDVYDEFSFGEKSPQAIRDFLQTARSTWTQAPRFVVLVGDATIDPRDYAGEGNGDFVPTKQVPMTVVALETASDDWFVDFDGNGLPDVPIGRLSVRTADQAASIVAKIVNYDAQGPQPWMKQVLLVADRDEEGGDFEQNSLSVAALLPPDYTAHRIFSGAMGADAAHAAIVDAVNAGQLLVNYVGHGSVQIWGSDGELLTSADVTDTWRNETRLPLVVAMNCLNGLFNQVWGEESLAEALQRSPNGGAVAVWASSSVTESEIQALVNQELFRLIFQGGAATIGEAIAAAKRVVADADVRRSWIFFGDPAMRLAGTPQPVSAPTPTAPSALRGVQAIAANDPPAIVPADDINALLDARGGPVRLMDVTGDGRADLMLYASESGRWAGVFTDAAGATLREGALGPAWQVWTTTLTGDGQADFLFYNRDTSAWAQTLTTREGTSKVTRGTLPGGGPQAQWHVGDFDGDRRDDVLLYDPASGGWTIGMSDGRRGVAFQRGTWSRGWRVEVADFDGDGRADVFGYDAATGRGRLMLNGREGRSTELTADWGRNWRVSVAELGGKTGADLLFYDPTSGAWQTATNDGGGHFALHTGTWEPGLEIHPIDLDGDGRDDVLGYNPTTGHWMTALTPSAGQFGAAAAGGTWTAGLAIATGDVNGDGRGDVVLYEASTGIWFEGVTVSPGVFAFESGNWLPGASIVGRPR